MRLCCHFNFRTFALLIVGLCFVQLSQSEPATRQPEYDSVSIGYIPSKGAHHEGALHVGLEAKTLAHHKSIEIEKFFTALSQLASEGRTDNATEFHGPTIYIDAVFQGKRVRLFFSGDSKLDKFNPCLSGCHRQPKYSPIFRRKVGFNFIVRRPALAFTEVWPRKSLVRGKFCKVSVTTG